VADLYRTIVRRTGATVSAGFGSHSFNLSGYLQGNTPDNHRTYNFTQTFTSGGLAHATISNGTYKLNYQDGDDPWELFNIATDPTESTNLNEIPIYAFVQTVLLNEIQKRQPTDADPTW
jgi:hypothetical protein